jgi:hypothetical protein
MQQVADEQEHRHPGQVDDCDRPRAGEEGPDLIEIAHRLVRLAGLARAQCQRDHGIVHDSPEVPVEQPGGAHHDARAHQVEHGLEAVGADQEDRQRNKGRDAVACQHAVIDLQHVERAGEHQDVHDTGKQTHAPECAAAIPQGRGDGGMLHKRTLRDSGHPMLPTGGNKYWVGGG